MLSRSAIALLVATVAAGCFRDDSPELTSASGTGTTSSGGTTTTGSPATGPGTTDVTGSGGATTTTTGTTTTGTTTGTTTDATTSTTTGTTTEAGTSSSTSGVSPEECVTQKNGKYECWLCCQDAVPSSEVYVQGLLACVCHEGDPCRDACGDDLCVDQIVNAPCLDCIAPQVFMDTCFVAAAYQCSMAPACEQFVDCALPCVALP